MLTALLLFLLYMLGMASWTLLEYLIHRFLGHRRGGRDPVALEHRTHHATVHYFAPIKRKVLLAIPVLLTIALLGATFLGLRLSAILTGGVGTGWALYERLHFRLHLRPPRGAYLCWAPRHHFDHHFMNPRTNFGVSSPFWDRAFGTYQAPRAVRVPRRAAAQMPWLPAAIGDDPTPEAPTNAEPLLKPDPYPTTR